MDDIKKNGETPELNPELRKKVLIGTAVQQALSALIERNRAEIIADARERLAAMGVTLTDDEVKL